MNVKKSNYLLLIIIIFGILYSLISFVNHYNFRTYALDLGAYTNALYDYIHFQWNDSTVFKEVKENLLCDHFDLYLILFSPLSLIFKTYTLLIVQLFFILLGGLGVYKYFSLIGKTAHLAIFATLFFYLFFGVFSAVSFDYHSNVVAASLMPWFFYFIKQKKIVATSLMLLFLIVSKENISLWMAFVCLGLLIEYRKEGFWRNYLFFSFCFCIFYFVLITSIVMPALSNNKTYPNFNYSVLGSNSFEALLFLIKHPLESLKILFINHTNHPFGDYVKVELHILVFLSGLPLLVFKPQYLLMLIPIYIQKLFHDNYSMWGIDGQYSIEYAPILAIGVFSAINEFKNKKIAKLTSIIVLITTLGCTIRIMDNTVQYTKKSRIRLYKSSHYTSDYSVNKVYEQLSKIPENAVVCVQSSFLPHLAYRDNIYQFPIIKDAEFIIYSEKNDIYPLDRKAFDSLTTALKNSNDWTVKYTDENLTILTKSANHSMPSHPMPIMRTFVHCLNSDSILNTEAKLVYTKQNLPNGLLEVDLQSFQKGTYYLKGSFGNKTISDKIILK